MSEELYMKILDRMDEVGQYDTITFSGIGEPLMDATLEQKVKLAHGRGYKVMVLTNGYHLTPRRAKKLMDAGCTSFRVSVFGVTPATYGMAHGTRSSDLYLTRANILAALDGTAEIILTFNVIPDVNEHEVDEWIATWEPIVDLVEVWHPHNWVSAKLYRRIQDEKLVTCGRPFNGPLQVQVDGAVIMCCFDTNGELLLGDLKTQSIEGVFNGEEYKHLRSNHVDGRHTLTICQHCDQRNADKMDIMVYNSRWEDLGDRVERTSTTYRRVTR
jgi:hypothetical protein